MQIIPISHTHLDTHTDKPTTERPVQTHTHTQNIYTPSDTYVLPDNVHNVMKGVGLAGPAELPYGDKLSSVCVYVCVCVCVCVCV